ncbi:hypothetical protein DFP73DRAFT_601930 [Morchella snyderi]|nr:hypothetical protein DFP73DRAFT_601930 [Morchella snyderi]
MPPKIMVPSFQNFQYFLDEKKKNTVKVPAYPDMNIEDPYLEGLSVSVKKFRECILTQANMRWKIEILFKRVVSSNEVLLKPGYKSEYKWKYESEHISPVELVTLKKLRLVDHTNFWRGLEQGTIYPEFSDLGKILQIRRAKESNALENIVAKKPEVYLESTKILKTKSVLSNTKVTDGQDALGKLRAGESMQYPKTTFPIPMEILGTNKIRKRDRETELPAVDTSVQKKAKMNTTNNVLESTSTIVMNSLDPVSVTNKNEIMRAIWDGENGVKTLVETVVKRETRKLEQSLIDLKEEIKTL